MKVKLGISNRHIHITEEDYKILFKHRILTKRNDLYQTGEFASTDIVTIKGPKGIIEKVRVMGPFRKYTQVEISKTDSYKLGITPKVSSSGNLDNAEELEIIYRRRRIRRKCAIIADRHIHISTKDLEKYKLNNIVKIKISNEKGGILENVKIKPSENGKLELHLDTDDANSNLLNSNDELEIIND